MPPPSKGPVTDPEPSKGRWVVPGLSCSLIRWATPAPVTGGL